MKKKLQVGGTAAQYVTGEAGLGERGFGYAGP